MKQQAERWHWRKVFQYFLQGLVIIAPIIITVWAVLSLFNFVDNILPNLVETVFPSVLDVDDKGQLKRLPGLGFVVVIVLVILIGWISSNFFVGKLVALFDTILEKTPGIKIIYSSVKDFLEAFAGDKKKFTHPVLVNVDGEDVWRVGFLTKESANHFGMEEHVIVYIPHSYAISGIVYLVPKNKVKAIDNISAAEAMKFTVSGGVTDIEA